MAKLRWLASTYDEPVAGIDPYRRLAGLYDLVIEPMLSGVRRVALEVLPPQPSWQVLDVGCGTGTWLAAYLEAGCAVAGVDVSEAMLARAETRLGGRGDLRLIDGTSLPFPEGQFDLVTTSMVLHEVPEGDREALVTEMARVARPEGRVLVADYRFGSLRGWKGPTLWALTDVVERLSGHYSGYRTFKAAGGLPGVVESAGLGLERNKIVAGGNLAIYVVLPDGRGS